MSIKQFTKNQTVRWNYFPDINTLIRYLDRKDFIELSKCNKFYRKQLERLVLGKLKLNYQYKNISKIYEGFPDTCKIEKISELLKSDLGPKLKLAQSVNIGCEIGRVFTKSFVKLLPNVKTLRYDAYWGCDIECDCDRDWQEGLIAALSCMCYLDHVEIEFEGMPVKDIGSKKQIFPKSLKSLNIILHCSYEMYEKESLYLYETIDDSYINLHTLTIVSNRVLQNLSSGVPNLQKVEIEMFELDKSKFINFFKANPQLKKLETRLYNYYEEMISAILTSIHLERWIICSWTWIDIEVNSLTSNYSIIHLRISYDVPAPISLKIINACKTLETLDLSCYTYHLDSLEWSKIERRINILKLSFYSCTINDIKEIDASSLFNSIYIERVYDYSHSSIKLYLDQINSIKLNNYKFSVLISKACVLKLINRAG